MKTRLSRRTLLRGAGGIAVGLPFLEVIGQTAPARRLVIFFSPDGVHKPTWTPTAVSSETQFTLSPTLSPLQAFKSKLLILDNLDQSAPLASTYGKNGHDRGMAGVLTGTKTSANRLATGISIDQAIAKRIGAPPGGFRSLELGVETNNVAGFSRICFSGPDAPVTPEENPLTTYNRIVASSASDPAALKLREKRKKIVDYLLGDYKALRPTLGSEDRARLDVHLASLESIQTELDSVAAACSVPAAPGSASTFPAKAKLQIDLMVLALKCDLTRVASLQLSKSVSRVIPNWLTYDGAPITKEHHDLTHYGDAVNDVKMLPLVDKWYAQQFQYLLASMDAVPEGSGTLLDNSVVVWCTNFGLGTSHAMQKTPFVLAGSAGGRLKTGRYVQFAPGTNHNKLLVTLDRVMGGTTNVFGDPSFPHGVLPGLLV